MSGSFAVPSTDDPARSNSRSADALAAALLTIGPSLTVALVVGFSALLAGRPGKPDDGNGEDEA